MSSNLIQVTITITKGPSASSPTGAAFAGTSVVVTDSTGTAQPPVLLTGAETPIPWSFTASVAVGNGSVSATDLDVNSQILGTPVTQTFTENGSPPSYLPSTGITVTPVTASVRKR